MERRIGYWSELGRVDSRIDLRNERWIEAYGWHRH